MVAGPIWWVSDEESNRLRSSARQDLGHVSLDLGLPMSSGTQDCGATVSMAVRVVSRALAPGLYDATKVFVSKTTVAPS